MGRTYQFVVIGPSLGLGMEFVGTDDLYFVAVGPRRTTVTPVFCLNVSRSESLYS